MARRKENLEKMNIVVVVVVVVGVLVVVVALVFPLMAGPVSLA